MTEGDFIHKVSLVESSLFSFSIQGSPSSNLKTLIENWVQSYLSHNPFPLEEAISLNHLTPFRQKILHTLLQLDLGQTLSYSKLAEHAGFPQAARAAGSACKRNDWPLLIPCHRILPKNQSLGQYEGGCEIKKRLLQFEGAFFKPDSIQ